MLLMSVMLDENDARYGIATVITKMSFIEGIVDFGDRDAH